MGKYLNNFVYKRLSYHIRDLSEITRGRGGGGGVETWKIKLKNCDPLERMSMKYRGSPLAVVKKFMTPPLSCCAKSIHIIHTIHIFCFTVDAMEVLIKYCMNSFPKLINSYKFKFLFTSCAFPIGQSVLKRNLIGSSKSNRKLINNILSNELINLRKGIGAIFYQHFHCIDSNIFNE
jgi:hypothetical protein